MINMAFLNRKNTYFQMISINPAVEVYQKIQKAYELIQTQYQQWINYASNEGTGSQYAPYFDKLILSVTQANASCKELIRKYQQKYDQIIELINMMDQILVALHQKQYYFYGYGNNTGTGTQLAGHIKYARDKAEDLRNKALILTTFQIEAEGVEVKQLNHLKCPQNHWLQFEDLKSFTCSRQGCGTIYHNQNQARTCKQCHFYACENCINHQQV